jgi:hypothetical protein
MTKRPYDAADFIWHGCPDGPTQFWALGAPTGAPGEVPVYIKTGTVKRTQTRPDGRVIEWEEDEYQTFAKEFLNRNHLDEYMRKPYHRCHPLYVLSSCQTYDWIWNMFDKGESDPTGELKRSAYRKRNAACQDVNALYQQLVQVQASDPRSLPDFGKCQNVHGWNIATYAA